MTVWDQSIFLVLAESSVQKTSKPIRLQVGYIRSPDSIDLEGATNGMLIAQKGMVDIVPALGHGNK